MLAATSREHARSRGPILQTILHDATAALGFSEEQPTRLPELIIGSAHGMPRAIGWVYRTDLLLTVAHGSDDELIDAFEQSSARTLEGEALVRVAIPDDWIVSGIELRACDATRIVRIIATGDDGQASILFESDAITHDEIEVLRSTAIGLTLRRIVDSIGSAVSNDDTVIA
ncbi:hypothetical protein [Burkholderia aenigmatica]|uniref:hypothetical protein n=1 Tax=Burkholderia aenigmatica TaxID=2015348 RepID=UPI002656B73A|nr:hypothetical protein [Burkholderia aenigmatica]MDN7880060.1 hypothetical protein [Burkholderia aenigmatica]